MKADTDLNGFKRILIENQTSYWCAEIHKRFAHVLEICNA